MRCFREVLRTDAVRPIEIRNRPGGFENPVVCAGTETHPTVSDLQRALACPVQHTKRTQDAMGICAL